MNTNELPYNFPEDTTEIELCGMELTTIPDLSGYKQLKYLNLTENKISKIENLEKLTGLEELLLSKNLIKDFKGLKNCPDLWKIYLDDNEITTLSFDALPEQLEILELTGNKIDTIKTGDNKHNRLRELHLTINPLNHLHGLELFPDLEMISIEGKNLKSISEDTYEFIVKKQLEEKKGSTPFYFFSSGTTTRKSIDQFVKRKKIEIVKNND